MSVSTRPKVSPIRMPAEPQVVDPALLEQLVAQFRILIGVVITAVVLVAVGIWYWSDYINRSQSASILVLEQERLEQIMDILTDIPRTPGLRLEHGPRRGAPTVAEVQRRLPHLRGISKRERDLACDRLVGVCQPVASSD